MNDERPYVSVVEPLQPAIGRVKTVLFRPFDLGKWFVIGFCAWLAGLGESGPGGGGGGGGGDGRAKFPHRGDLAGQVKDGLGAAREFAVENLYWIVPVVIVVVVVAIAIWLLVTWLNSRGRFMFLHCVAENKAEVVAPWHKFRRQGNSLFVFRIVLGLIGFGVIAVTLAAGIGLAVAAAASKSVVGLVLSLISMICAVIIFAVALAVIVVFTDHFVVPIMFLGTASCRAAWRQFLGILSVNKGRFVLYLLFQILIGIVIGMIVFAAVCLTCCCACCIFAIPYIGTVALLPILVFERSYSLYYLRQYGPSFDVFAGAA
jgi:hypothetical protein